MKKITVILALILVSMIIISGCTSKEKENEDNVGSTKSGEGINTWEESEGTEVEPSGFLNGVSLSPKSFESEDFTGFFEKAGEAGEIVIWAGDWGELEKESSGSKVVTELASTYDYIPIVEVQFFTQSTGELIRPLDEGTKEEYKNSIVNFAEKYKPEYLGMGIEVNILYEKSPEDFEDFVGFYSEVYDSIKEKSPETKVFTVFQLEKMKGLNGGLFGGENDPTKSEWFLLEEFPKSDLVAFTTYPSLIYKDPSEIPNEYYSEIEQHTSKPIGFTEIGWHSGKTITGWESSEEEQDEFVSRFFELSEELDKELVIWSFLYDQETIEPFNSMGLYDSNGNEKLAWEEWIDN